MKKIIIVVAMVFSIGIIAQTCGFDEVQKNLELKYPEIKKNRELAETQLLGTDVKSYLKKIGATSRNGLYDGTIYEIPVVVHLITSTAASNSGLALTDNQIINWINNCNKMFATTYGNGFFPEGTGSIDGNVIPIKLVLAKRTPQCTPSNGIVRYNGSTISGYDQFGVQRSTVNGAMIEQVKALAPHWPENSYFNIYVVIGFDGDKSTFGLLGWSGYPTNPDAFYESFMKVTVVTNNNDSTLAHEFGHGLGLLHTFEGAPSSPTNNPPIAADCPINNNCLIDNDRVCDTAPCASLLNVNPTPTNAVVNPCTGTFYDGVQYNIMNYTRQPRKFTAGQRDRALSVFMQYRANLTNSLGGTDLATDPGAGTLTAANCSPTGITNSGNFGMGPTTVFLGNINNVSDPYNTINNQYYVDYSLQNCTSKAVYTDIPPNKSSELNVSFGTNPQFIKAWIDYNNNGIFESSELIGASATRVSTESSPFVIIFTPPTTAVKDTFLRMRIIADYTNDTACQNLSYGQTEDYSVRIATSLATSENSKDSSDLLYYSKSENKLSLTKFNSKGFGAYKIYDMNGNIVQKGNAASEILINQVLPKGTYIVHYQNTSKKFINN
ncbi:zinc-dependent metalloprotease [Chryseobacterium gotjawalense]|uniref:Zinc-dependent metalloprotease n=1 Tax=Chryseobacterium gotjawalense TaxID=3042315 RepID=A0ABY8RB22_9FLAO|nr:zinc-dependent metalloprotease [Chryseobacterium sp. wdc7]WHF51155.1 zinc-dependent metalloprotease [Chryseobacterium sp. wdc7]